MNDDGSLRWLKVFVRAIAVGLLLVIFTFLIFASEGARPLGYLFFGVIGFFAWRMYRKWDKTTVQLYALTQVMVTMAAIDEIGNRFWPHMGPALGGFICLIYGPPFERFLLRYTSFSSAPPYKTIPQNLKADVDGTPWQQNPGHVR